MLTFTTSDWQPPVSLFLLKSEIWHFRFLLKDVNFGTFYHLWLASVKRYNNFTNSDWHHQCHDEVNQLPKSHHCLSPHETHRQEKFLHKWLADKKSFSTKDSQTRKVSPQVTRRQEKVQISDKSEIIKTVVCRLASEGGMIKGGNSLEILCVIFPQGSHV